MTTKDCYLSLKGKHEILFPSNGQYSNLNLNGYNKYSNLSSPYSSTASYISSRKEDISNFGEKINCHGKNNISNSWTKADFKKHDLFGQNFNGRNDMGNDMNVQSDNMTLHIESYESYIKSIGASSEKDLNAKSTNSSMKQSGSCNKWKSAKEILTNPSSVVQNPFELPRQQSELDGDKEKPEIAKFKASQKLLAPFHDYAYDKSNTAIKPNIVIRAKKNTYKITQRISENVFKAKDEHSRMVIIKFFKNENEKKCLREKEIYEKLAAIKSSHFLQLYDIGQRGNSKFIIVSLLDSTVFEKFPLGYAERCHVILNRDATKLNNFTKVILAKQMLQSLEHLHSVGVIHGDLNWDNFGVSLNETIILFDFEKSLYVDKDKRITTAPPLIDEDYDPVYDPNPAWFYAPLAYYKDQKFHFKEDVESLCYMLCELFTALPWSESTTSKEKEDCFKEGSDFLTKIPNNLRAMHQYARQLDYNERPNYKMLSSMIDGFFKPKDMKPILEWNENFVYNGCLMPPHEFVPYFDYSQKGGHLVLIYKCERWNQYRKEKASTKETQYYCGAKGSCPCVITILGSVDKMFKEGKLKRFSIAKINKAVFKCPKHESEDGYPHICFENEQHEYFDNLGKLAKKQLEAKKNDEEKKQAATKKKAETNKKESDA